MSCRWAYKTRFLTLCNLVAFAVTTVISYQSQGRCSAAGRRDAAAMHAAPGRASGVRGGPRVGEGGVRGRNAAADGCDGLRGQRGAGAPAPRPAQRAARVCHHPFQARSRRHAGPLM